MSRAILGAASKGEGAYRGRYQESRHTDGDQHHPLIRNSGPGATNGQQDEHTGEEVSTYPKGSFPAASPNASSCRSPTAVGYGRHRRRLPPCTGHHRRDRRRWLRDRGDRSLRFRRATLRTVHPPHPRPSTPLAMTTDHLRRVSGRVAERLASYSVRMAEDVDAGVAVGSRLARPVLLYSGG
jgi:hypothetical protein